MRLAHLADLHFGEHPPALANLLGADIRAAAPDAILVSGDLTRRALPSEFAAAFAFLAALEAPVLAVPGNHDIPGADLWSRFFHPRRGWRAAAPPDEPYLRLGDIQILGLDTVSRAQWHLDWSAGAISSRRRAVLAGRLREMPDIPALVVCHHPLQHSGWARTRRRPRGADAALALLRGAPVRAVLCGHLHYPEAVKLGDPWPLQVMAPSALSPRGGRSANGWNLVSAGASGLRVQTRLHVAGEWSSIDLLAGT